MEDPPRYAATGRLARDDEPARQPNPPRTHRRARDDLRRGLRSSGSSGTRSTTRCSGSRSWAARRSASRRAVVRSGRPWISVGLVSIGAIAGGIILLPDGDRPARGRGTRRADVLAPASRRRIAAVRHTRYGWWLEEAGAVEPAPPLEGDTTADVVIVGGGYLGLWTAWQLKALEPELDVVVLEAAARGPRAERPERRLRVDAVGRPRRSCATASATSARSRSAAPPSAACDGIGAWCEAQGVDAWYRAAPTLYVATTEAQLGAWDDASRRARRSARPRRSSTARRRGAARALRVAALPRRRRSYRLGATVQPARLALGLRGEVLERGVRLHERTRVAPPRATRRRRRAAGRVRAGAAVLAVNSATAPVPRLPARARRRLEPHGGHGARARRDRGARLDGRRGDRRLPHAAPLPPHDPRRPDRVRLGRRAGWASAAAQPRGSRSTPASCERPRDEPRPLLPAAPRPRASRTPGAGRSTSPPRTCRSSAAAGASTTASASPGTASARRYLGGEILARLALDRRDELTALAIVEPTRKLMPPEPFRWAGGSLIRARARREGRRRGRGQEARFPFRAGGVATAAARTSASTLERRTRSAL